jgi:hypothetical protein
MSVKKKTATKSKPAKTTIKKKSSPLARVGKLSDEDMKDIAGGGCRCCTRPQVGN